MSRREGRLLLGHASFFQQREVRPKRPNYTSDTQLYISERGTINSNEEGHRPVHDERSDYRESNLRVPIGRVWGNTTYMWEANLKKIKSFYLGTKSGV